MKSMWPKTRIKVNDTPLFSIKCSFYQSYAFLLEPGGPPESLLATALSSTSIQIEWLEIDPILRFGIILSYNIKYQRTDEKDVLKEITSLNRSAVISGLNEYTDYDLSVAGSTSKGVGMYSAFIKHRTLEHG